MEYRQKPTIQLTHDTDPGRINRSPCLLRDNAGRLVALYEKVLDTGRTSMSRVTYSPDTFNITVEAGEGVVNGRSVAWSEASLTVEPDSYSLVYVDADGTVRQTPSASHSHTVDSVLLAYVSSGTHSIVRVEELEKSGTYIYFKVQVPGSGNTWVWDDREYRLNSGERPYAVIDRDANKIYLSYIRDGRSMVRVIDTASITPGRNSLEFIPHFSTTSDTIHLDNDPGGSAGVSSGAGTGSVTFSDDIFPFTAPDVTFRESGSGLERVFNLPVIEGSYKGHIKGPVVLTFYSLNGGEYTPVREVEFLHLETRATLPSVWFSMEAGGVQKLYAGITVKHGLYSGAFRTRPSRYAEIRIPEDQCRITERASGPEAEVKDEVYSISSGSGFGIVSKLTESDQDFMSVQDSGNAGAGAGKGSVTKTFEYDSKRHEVSDASSPIGAGAGYGHIIKLSETGV